MPTKKPTLTNDCLASVAIVYLMKVFPACENTVADFEKFNRELSLVFSKLKQDQVDEFLREVKGRFGKEFDAFLKLVRCVAAFVLEKSKSEEAESCGLQAADELVKKSPGFSFPQWPTAFLNLSDEFLNLLSPKLLKDVAQFICENRSPVKSQVFYNLHANIDKKGFFDGGFHEGCDSRLLFGKLMGVGKNGRREKWWLSPDYLLLDRAFGFNTGLPDAAEKFQKELIAVDLTSQLFYSGFVRFFNKKTNLLLTNSYTEMTFGAVFDQIVRAGEQESTYYKEVLSGIDQICRERPELFEKLVMLLYSGVFANFLILNPPKNLGRRFSEASKHMAQAHYQAYCFYFSHLKKFFPKSFAVEDSAGVKLHADYEKEFFQSAVIDVLEWEVGRFDTARSPGKVIDYIAIKIMRAFVRFVENKIFSHQDFVRQVIPFASQLIAMAEKFPDKRKLLLEQPALLQIFIMAKLINMPLKKVTLKGSSVDDKAFAAADMSSTAGRAMLVRRWFKPRKTLLWGGLKKYVTESEKDHFRRFVQCFDQHCHFAKPANAKELAIWFWNNPVPYKKNMYYPRALMKCCQALCGDDKKLREKAYIEIEALRRELKIPKRVVEETAVIVNAVAGVGSGMGSAAVNGGSAAEILKAQGVSGTVLTAAHAVAVLSGAAGQSTGARVAPGGAGGGAGASAVGEGANNDLAKESGMTEMTAVRFR